MIENKTFTATGEDEFASKINLAKTVGRYIADTISADVIEYSDGCVIRKDGCVDIGIVVEKVSSVYDYINNITIYTSAFGTFVAYQTNENLSEDTTSVQIKTDFTINNFVNQMIYTSSVEGGSEASISFLAMTNGESLVMKSKYLFILCIQDEDEKDYLGTSISNLCDDNGTEYGIKSIINSSLSITRENPNQVIMIDMFLQLNNTCSKRMKKLYSIMKHSNIQEGSRYRFDGYEYYALSDTVLFRLEGGD